MTNQETYQIIYNKLKENPDLKAASLCKQHKASYSGFRYWITKQTNGTKGPQNTAAASFPDNNDSVTVFVPLSRVAALYVAGLESMSLPIEEIVSQLSKEQFKTLFRHLGKGARASR